MRDFQADGRLNLELVDIGLDRDLTWRYGLLIPVLEFSGGPSLEWPFDRVDVQRALD